MRLRQVTPFGVEMPEADSCPRDEIVVPRPMEVGAECVHRDIYRRVKWRRGNSTWFVWKDCPLTPESEARAPAEVRAALPKRNEPRSCAFNEGESCDGRGCFCDRTQATR